MSNIYRSILPSASRTTTQTGDTFGTGDRIACHVVLDCTVNAGGLGSVTLTIQGYDKVSAKWYTILAGAAVTTVSTNVYKVMPGGPVAANVSANDVLPPLIRILVTANNANPITYSVGIALMQL